MHTSFDLEQSAKSAKPEAKGISSVINLVRKSYKKVSTPHTLGISQSI